MASRLADIYKSEIGRGGGLGSAIGKRLGEKIDPRQMFDQSGLLTAMFPSLKAYNATAKASGTKRAETNSVGNMSSAAMGAVLASSNLTAKNTMVLPAMARDMNLMRQNVAKLVKLQGGKPAMKGDMFFKKAGERNTLFESALGKMGGVTAKGGKGLNLFGLSSEKDGQTPETALYVKSATGDEGGGLTDWLKSLAAGAAGGGAIRGLASIAGSIISSPAFIASAAIGGTALLARYMKDRNDAELRKPENANVPANMVQNGLAANNTAAAAQNRTQAIALGGLTTGTANDIVQRLIEDKLKGAAADNFCNDVVRGSNLALVLDKCSNDMKQRYLDMVAKDTAPAPAAVTPTPAPTPMPSTSVPDTTSDARRGRGYIPPEPTTPSNAVVSGTGGTISTGSGGMVVSPSYETTPTPMPMPTPAPTPAPTPSTPKPILSNPSEGESAVRAAAAKYGITDPTELNALLAQVAHESGDYKYLTELGGRKYFDKYEGRRDLGNTQPGDGYKYRGRGYIQLTGRDNYTAFSKFSGIDVVNNPDLVSTPSVGAEAALWFWQKRVKPKIRDFNDVKAVTQIVNGGQNGIADRTQKFQTLMASSTSNQSSPSTALAAAPSSSIPAGTQIASASSEVTAARYAGRAQMRQQPPAPVVVNAGGSGDTRILTTQKSTPYNGEFYASLVSSKAL